MIIRSLLATALALSAAYAYCDNRYQITLVNESGGATAYRQHCF